MIASLSGIRGVYNEDLTLVDVSRFVSGFARATGGHQFLLARDPRASGPSISRTAAAALMASGATVYDYGVISTPALFRESRTRKLPAVMVTASHNEPQFNGLKFMVGGAGIGKLVFDSLASGPRGSREGFREGALKPAGKPSYVDDIVERFGPGCGRGVRVALDLGGGAAISHAAALMNRLGCEVTSLNDSFGVFARKVDPVTDDLLLLRKAVKEKGCDIGLGFDCDGDRLVIVDSEARKRSGDYMLTLALSELLAETGEKRVVVSLDTTRAIDDIAAKRGCQVYRSKVGEANVVGTMNDRGARLGGEGSSGGLIDGDFNFCRDSMLAAVAIIRAIRSHGRKLYDSVPSYHQARVAIGISKPKALAAMKKLSREHGDAETMDGLKIPLEKKAWVLMRPSGTEDVVRVSAESTSAAEAQRIADSFAKKLKGLSR